MKTILAVIIAGLFFAGHLRAEPPKAPEDTQSLSYLISQAQKIKLGSTKEAEVYQLLGQPALEKTKIKTMKSEMGLVEIKVLVYGPQKNLRVYMYNGVVINVEFP
jgi:hypothetical protein